MLRQAKGMQKNTPWVDRFPNRAGVPKRHLKGSFRLARDPSIIQKRRCTRLRTCSGPLVLVRWQPHPMQQVSVAGVGADVPETRESVEEDQPTSALQISHFEELKRLRFLAHNATGSR